MPKTESAKRRARRHEEVIYFHEAALSGYNHQQIASLASTRFGRSIGAEAVRRRLKDYRDARVLENVETLRWQEVDRLDRYLATLDKVILAADLVTEQDDDGVERVVADNRKEKIAAVTTALRVADRRAKLLGLDAPVQAEVVVTTMSPADLEMEALAAEVAERNER